jgi:hypothetical protein
MSFWDILLKSWSGRLPARNGGTFTLIELEGIGVELVEGVQVFSPDYRLLFGYQLRRYSTSCLLMSWAIPTSTLRGPL